MGSCFGKKSKVQSSSGNASGVGGIESSDSKILEKPATSRKSVAPISTEQFILLNFTAYDYDYDYDARVINNDTNIDDEFNENGGREPKKENNASEEEIVKGKSKLIGINMGDDSHRTGALEHYQKEGAGSQVYGNTAGSLMNGQLSAITKPSLMVLRKMGDTTTNTTTTAPPPPSATEAIREPTIKPYSSVSRTVQITDFNS